MQSSFNSLGMALFCALLLKNSDPAGEGEPDGLYNPTSNVLLQACAFILTWNWIYFKLLNFTFKTTVKKKSA